MDKPRAFESYEELVASVTPEQLLKWVNHYAEMIQARDESGARYRKKQQLFAQVCKRMLDQDELDRIAAEAEERVK